MEKTIEKNTEKTVEKIINQRLDKKAEFDNTDAEKIYKVKHDDSFIYRIKNSKKMRIALYCLMFLSGAFLFTQSGLKSFIVVGLFALIPLFMGIAIAWILNPTVKVLMSKGISRKASSFWAFVMAIIVVFLLALMILPPAVGQVETFVKMFLDEGDNGFRERLTRFAVTYFGRDHAEFRHTVDTLWNDAKHYIMSFATANGLSLLLSLGTGLLSALMGITIGFYLLGDYDKYIDTVKNMLPDTDASGNRLMTKLHITIMNWFKGWIVDQSFILVGSALFLFFFGVEQWLVLALIMVLTNLIPFVGPFIGIGFVGIFLSVMLIGNEHPLVHTIFGYEVGPMVALVGVLIGLIIVQSIESMIIIPLAYKKAVKIHPVTTLASLSLVSALLSPFLLPLTIPGIAMFKTIYKHYRGKELNL